MFDTIIIGGGPSGLMTASTIEKSKKILLIEKNEKLGKKLLASGNGRCNVTNLCSNEDFVKNIQSKNYRFILSSLSKFSAYDVFDFFNCETPLKVEDNDRVFPASDKSDDILQVLKNKIQHVKINLNEVVTDIAKDKEYFVVTTNKGVYNSKNVVLSLGGKSYPDLGTTGDGYKLLSNFNLKIVEPAPALASLNSENEICKALQGTSLNSKVTYQKKSFNGNMLFTHFGLSGPAIFKVSESVIKEINSKPVLNLDFLPDFSEEEIKEEFMQSKDDTLFKYLKQYLPQKFIKFLLPDYNKAIKSFSKNEINLVLNKLKNFEIVISSTKGYKAAFVTSGGLDLSEVNPSTLEVKKVPNLYVTGELLDIHALTGGFNITIAFSTGYSCGCAINKSKK